jgi:hypothetical protein
MRDSYYSQLMTYIALDIEELRQRYDRLQRTLEYWDDRFSPTSKTSGLSLEEIADLKASIESRQHDLFIQWYEMNEKARLEGRPFYLAGKVRELGGYLINVASYKDLLTERKG